MSANTTKAVDAALTTVFGCIGYMVMVPLLVAALVLLNGWALSILWGWFMVPLGLPTIGINAACGLSCVIGYCTGSRKWPTKNKEDTLAGVRNTAYMFAYPLLTLLAGYIIHLFA